MIIPDHPTIGFVEFIRASAPRDTITILSDHNPHRATFVAKQEELPTRTAQDRAFLRTISQFDAVHIINPLLIQAFEKSTEKKIVFIPNGSRRWASCRPVDSIFSSRSVVALSRLTKSKRVDHLIDAFDMVSNRRPDWKLQILGRGPDESELKKRVQSLGLNGKVVLEGFDPDIDKRFLSAAFMVSASRLENLSLAYLEAAGTGTPIVAYDGNATARYFNSEGVDFFSAVPDGNVEALAKAMDRMMQMVEDRDLTVARMSADAYEFSQRFCPEVIAKHWKQALLSLREQETIGT
ncbi:glycosyltransferase [Maritimibacter fusiformis]|uniref:Glycosyltransferase family 4 protein n=1 Tax=Maritimibacter fusiformis TaxID=2603819 RepID=A0A5D0RLQ2_9RHOB|nr:glycosyltransferase [Maritimibacter fusiformis]TYB82442.1 glycosyltransferase family 4 protein [Maritimibacter fusiformis]